MNEFSPPNYKALYEKLVAAIEKRQREKIASDETVSQNFYDFVDAAEVGSMPDWSKAQKSTI